MWDVSDFAGGATEYLPRRLHQLYEAKKNAKTDDERRDIDRLIEERIRLIGAGQGHEP
jgi:hypothetical protein